MPSELVSELLMVAFIVIAASVITANFHVPEQQECVNLKVRDSSAGFDVIVTGGHVRSDEIKIVLLNHTSSTIIDTATYNGSAFSGNILVAKAPDKLYAGTVLSFNCSLKGWYEVIVAKDDRIVLDYLIFFK